MCVTFVLLLTALSTWDKAVCVPELGSSRTATPSSSPVCFSQFYYFLFVFSGPSLANTICSIQVDRKEEKGKSNFPLLTALLFVLRRHNSTFNHCLKNRIDVLIDPKFGNFAVAALKSIQIKINFTVLTRNIQVNQYATNKQEQMCKRQSVVQRQE